MKNQHLSLSLLNPAFTEEEGVTRKAGRSIAFRNSAGIPRMLHVNACEKIPAHLGLHSLQRPDENSECRMCCLMDVLFIEQNEFFNKLVSKYEAVTVPGKDEA